MSVWLCSPMFEISNLKDGTSKSSYQWYHPPPFVSVQLSCSSASAHFSAPHAGCILYCASCRSDLHVRETTFPLAYRRVPFSTDRTSSCAHYISLQHIRLPWKRNFSPSPPRQRPAMLVAKSCRWRNVCYSSAPLLQPPTSREVHLWCLSPNEVHQASLLCAYESILPFEERSLLREANNKRVQKEYLLTRILARTLLARYTGELVEPSALKFERGRLGKPKIVWPSHTIAGQTWHPPQISFNISHTGSLIICAVSGASQVGIDVEEKDRETHTNLIRFARRKFSEMEAGWLEHLDDVEARKNLFLRLWTLKESYGKAFGKGIAGTTLQDAAFCFDEFSSMPEVFPDYLTGLQAHEQVFQIKPDVSKDPNVWQFVLLELTNTHYASVCVQRCERLEQRINDIDPLHLQIMKTIPLVKDEPLVEAVALGLSI